MKFPFRELIFITAVGALIGGVTGGLGLYLYLSYLEAHTYPLVESWALIIAVHRGMPWGAALGAVLAGATSLRLHFQHRSTPYWLSRVAVWLFVVTGSVLALPFVWISVADALFDAENLREEPMQFLQLHLLQNPLCVPIVISLVLLSCGLPLLRRTSLQSSCQ